MGMELNPSICDFCGGPLIDPLHGQEDGFFVPCITKDGEKAELFLEFGLCREVGYELDEDGYGEGKVFDICTKCKIQQTKDNITLCLHENFHLWEAWLWDVEKYKD